MKIFLIKDHNSSQEYVAACARRRIVRIIVENHHVAQRRGRCQVPTRFQLKKISVLYREHTTKVQISTLQLTAD